MQRIGVNLRGARQLAGGSFSVQSWLTMVSRVENLICGRRAPNRIKFNLVCGWPHPFEADHALDAATIRGIRSASLLTHTRARYMACCRWQISLLISIILCLLITTTQRSKSTIVPLGSLFIGVEIGYPGILCCQRRRKNPFTDVKLECSPSAGST
jgi:hypothetical protein